MNTRNSTYGYSLPYLATKIKFSKNLIIIWYLYKANIIVMWLIHIFSIWTVGICHLIWREFIKKEKKKCCQTSCFLISNVSSKFEGQSFVKSCALSLTIFAWYLVVTLCFSYRFIYYNYFLILDTDCGRRIWGFSHQ
jgi:hypothetical protein